jgi:hypothetical protein
MRAECTRGLCLHGGGGSNFIFKLAGGLVSSDTKLSVAPGPLVSLFRPRRRRRSGHLFARSRTVLRKRGSKRARHEQPTQRQGTLAPVGPFAQGNNAISGMARDVALRAIALKTRYSINLRNNGRIYLSVRNAANETGLNKDTIARAFRELERYGFIVQTKGGCLGVEGKGKAPHWLLTELGYMADPPTKDFLRWSGTKVRDAKN